MAEASERLNAARQRAAMFETENGRLKQQLDDVISELHGLRERYTALEERATDAEQRLARVAPGRVVTADAGGGFMNWQKALALCGGDYVTARRKYPNAYAQVMKQQPQKARR